MAKPKNARSAELGKKSDVKDSLADAYKDILKGFQDQRGRVDDNLDHWDAYNGVLSEKQFYNGNSKIFVPILADAVDARATRWANQVFPQSGRYAEVTTVDGEIPHATIALLEHYVRLAKLRTSIVPALLKAGDIEGQYSLYCDWTSRSRTITRWETRGLQVGGMEAPEFGTEENLIEDEKTTDERPDVWIIPDGDLLVLPTTVDSIEEAIEMGGSVTVLRRWTKAKIKKLISDGEIIKEEGEALEEALSGRDPEQHRDTKKEIAEAAGAKAKMKLALVYEVWTRLKIDKKWRLVRAWMAGEDRILSVKLCPYWCDRVPVISGPVNKLPGVFKGDPPIKRVLDLQILANDACNEAADTAHFSAMPIIMTDPEKNPRVGSMVLGLASIWETSPNDTKFAQFPELWKHGFDIINSCKQQIFQSMGVNPAMMPQSTGAKNKRNQAEIAAEQQVDLLTTADAVTNLEETILTPLLTRFAEYDHQFRIDEITIRNNGEFGRRAQMEKVDVLQLGERWEFRWFGVEAARSAAQVQQQIAGMNILKAIPPQMLPGKKLDLGPLAAQLTENLFGPRLAPLILVDLKEELSVDPKLENDMLTHGFDVQVHQMDDDQKHMQAHVQLLQQMMGDPVASAAIKAHLMLHQQQLQAKQQAASMQQAGVQPGAPGAGGGPPAGAQPGPQRMKQPPGAIHQDRMPAAGAMGMPRKT